MRNSLGVMFAALILTGGSCGAVKAARIPDRDWPITAEISMLNPEIIPGEELRLRMTFQSGLEVPTRFAHVFAGGRIETASGQRAEVQMPRGCGTWVKQRELTGYWEEKRGLTIPAKGSTSVNGRILDHRTSMCLAPGHYRINVEYFFGKTADGNDGKIRVVGAVEFEVLEPRGEDKAVWEAVWAEGVKTSGEEGCRTVFRKALETHPASRYAPYILFYDLRDYATFLDRYPEHPLAAEVMMWQVKRILGQGDVFVVRPKRPEAKAEAREMLTALRKKYPDSDAAWEAPYMEKMLDALDEYHAAGGAPAPALEKRVMEMGENVPVRWVAERMTELYKVLHHVRTGEWPPEKGKAK